MIFKRREVAQTPQLDYKAKVIRAAILIGLVALALSGCGGGEERQRATVYESRPVSVLPPESGFVYSPFESNGTMIDVTGYSSGQKVKDPGTNKIFIVP